MKLDFIDIENLKISPYNVRKHGDTSGKDLIPSIRTCGVVQPLLVRKTRGVKGASPTRNNEAREGFEVIAGQRRFNACTAIAKDTKLAPIPCAILEEGDDAAAIEASLAENVARLPMDELDQFEAFRNLSEAGRCIEEIASTFGVTERLVKQRLALAELHPPILKAYRTREDIRAGDLRLLTMATKKQQKAWWKLAQSKEEYPPLGHRLKSWLFDGDAIPLSHALFDVETYKGAITTDLFEEEQYFADGAQFWEYQSRAIAELVADYKDEGWSSVIVHDVGERWYNWDCVSVGKEEGGEVHITCAADGAVNTYVGYLDEKIYKKRQKSEGNGEEAAPVARPELTKSMQNYLALHRHSAVRTELLQNQGVALRLLVAQSIAGFYTDPQKASTEAIGESLTANKAEAPFANERTEVRAMLDMRECENVTLVPRKEDWSYRPDVHVLFAKLLTLNDAAVMRILTFVAAEKLPAESALVDVLGTLLNVEMNTHWQPDETFFDLFKDKEAINAALGEAAGQSVADAHVTSTVKVQKSIIAKCLSGEREGGDQDWQPRYMGFPMQSYTKRGGIEAVTRWNAVEALFEAA